MKNDSDISANMGRWLILLAWVIAIALATWFFHKWYEEQTNPNKLLNYQETDTLKSIELKQNRGGHYTLPGEINGKPVTLLIDTGATIVSIPERVAKKLNLNKGIEQKAHTAGGVITVYSTTIETLKIGPIILHNIAAAVTPDMPGDEVLLGMNALKKLEFIHRDNKLILNQYED